MHARCAQPDAPAVSPPPSTISRAPVPGQRALSGKRMRAVGVVETIPDAALLDLGRQWRASIARMRVLLDRFDDPDEYASAVAQDKNIRESETATKLRRQIVRTPARTWDGIKLKIDVAAWSIETGHVDEEFEEILEEDDLAVDRALSWSLIRDLAAWTQCSPNAERAEHGNRHTSSRQKGESCAERFIKAAADATGQSERAIQHGADTRLLALGREWEASVARQRNLNAAINASVDTASPAFEALLDETVKQAEVSAQLRRRIVRLRARTWPGMLLKIALATQFCDVDAADFADILERDQHVVGEALTASLCRDLRTWFGRPDPDEELLILGRQFDESWAEERACDAAAERAASEEEREALLREAEDAAERTLALACVIESESATTLAGLAVKARVVSWTHSGEPFDEDFFIDREPPTMDHRLTISILRDLAAIDGRPLPLAAPAAVVTKAA